MNHSIYGADRATHLKIAVVTLLMATAVAGLGLSLRYSKTLPAETAAVLKAMKPVALSSSGSTISR